MTAKRKLYAPPMLIGLKGSHGCGKSTLARAIAQRYEGFVVYSFADDMRRQVTEYLAQQRLADPVVARYMHSVGSIFAHGVKDRVIPGIECTPRDLLIEIGEGQRKLDPDYWVDQMRERIAETHRHVIIDDVLFENEEQMIRGVNGMVFALETREDVRIKAAKLVAFMTEVRDMRWI